MKTNNTNSSGEEKFLKVLKDLEKKGKDYPLLQSATNKVANMTRLELTEFLVGKILVKFGPWFRISSGMKIVTNRVVSPNEFKETFATADKYILKLCREKMLRELLVGDEELSSLDPSDREIFENFGLESPLEILRKVWEVLPEHYKNFKDPDLYYLIREKIDGLIPKTKTQKISWYDLNLKFPATFEKTENMFQGRDIWINVDFSGIIQIFNAHCRRGNILKTNGKENIFLCRGKYVSEDFLISFAYKKGVWKIKNLYKPNFEPGTRIFLRA